MEVAYLLNDQIYLEEERRVLEDQNVVYSQIVKTLESKFRVHSDKKAFTCLCCKKPVSMVLRQDKFHFKHFGEGCPSSENYGRYTKQIKEEENEQPHRLGKTIIRTYLEGQLKIHSVEIKEGYSYRKSLKIIPDLLIYFPNGDVWVVDYITGKKQVEAYNSFIKKRKEVYENEGFKYFFFIDKTWLSSEHPSIKAVSLYPAENQMVLQGEQDQFWEVWIANLISKTDEDFTLNYLFRFTQTPQEKFAFEVRSLLYVDPSEGTAVIQRLVKLDSKWGLNIFRTEISLEKAASLNSAKTQFKWFVENEETQRTKKEIEIIAAYKNFKEEKEIEFKQEELNAKNNKMEFLSKVKSDLPGNASHSNHHLPQFKPPTDTTLSELFAKLQEQTIDVDEASVLYDYYKGSKIYKSKDEMEEVRSLARAMIGPITNPNYWDRKLREILINFALL
ncbi:competence protein CoiA family protein [Paenibacillus zanthoxyli]|uniref:hypothetical protein n=1 Tax=Paenibacillus zanthoxyli TaxID=369399 RepID=UPI00046F2A31|nr:hypothetical protein [Paenibacillus zanthoxyli]